MIEVERVTRSFGPVVAVDDLSFSVGRGEVVGLLGPNGAGKSTMLRMIATLLRPDRGSIRIDGVDVLDDPQRVRARLGYQTGDTGLYGRLTPREFVRYFGVLNDIPGPELEARITRLVDDLAISQFADRACATLSTGQKQRVSLARTLINDPPVLVLDEPTSGLDIVSSASLLETMKGLAQQGRAVLFSTHIMSEVEILCDRVVVIHRGRRLADGTIPELLELTNTTNLSRAFLSLVQAEDARAEAR
jgi:sodium transport system ATP-binding protein